MANGQLEEVHHDFSAQGPSKHIERLKEARDEGDKPHMDIQMEVCMRVCVWHASSRRGRLLIACVEDVPWYCGQEVGQQQKDRCWLFSSRR